MPPHVPTRLGVTYAAVYDAFRRAQEAPIPNGKEEYDLSEEERQSLLDYLGRLGPAADMALQDAISRWLTMGKEPTVESFGEVGLTVIDTTRPSQHG